MTAADELRLTTPSATEIVLTRSFAAARHLVFAALTRPELLRRWYGARGWNLIECDVDLREGGGWRFVSAGPGGERMTQSGVYRQIRPPDRLVYTEVFADQSYPGTTLITHDLTELAGVTTLTSTIRYATSQGRDTALRYPMKRGVAESYQRLDALLDTMKEERS